MIHQDQLPIKKAIKRVGRSRKLSLSLYRPESFVHDEDDDDCLLDEDDDDFFEEMQREEEEDFARLAHLGEALKSLSEANIMLRESCIALRQGLVLAEHYNRLAQIVCNNQSLSEVIIDEHIDESAHLGDDESM